MFEPPSLRRALVMMERQPTRYRRFVIFSTRKSRTILHSIAKELSFKSNVNCILSGPISRQDDSGIERLTCSAVLFLHEVNPEYPNTRCRALTVSSQEKHQNALHYCKIMQSKCETGDLSVYQLFCSWARTAEFYRHGPNLQLSTCLLSLL